MDNIYITTFNENAETIRRNPRLLFIKKINDYGEIVRTGNTTIETSIYKQFDIEYSCNEIQQKKVTISGSIHKYYQNNTNYADFSIFNFIDAINNLSLELGIDLKEQSVNSFEFGINIPLNYPCRIVLDSLLIYKGLKPNTYNYSNDGSMVKFYQKQMHFKIYDKSTQYKINSNNNSSILRIEMHIEKRQYLEKKNINIKRVKDLCKIEVWEQLATLLKSNFKSIITAFIEFNPQDYTPKELNLIKQASNSQFWIALKRNENRMKYNRIQRQYQLLQQKNPSTDWQNNICILIENKYQKLLTLNSDVKTETKKMLQIYTNIECNNVTKRKCLITGIDISNQYYKTKYVKQETLEILESKSPNTYLKLLTMYGDKIYNDDTNKRIERKIQKLARTSKAERTRQENWV